MRAWCSVLLAGAVLATAPTNAEVRSEAKASVLHNTISGKTCVNSVGFVKFGPSAPGSRGTFERNGRRPGTYAIGNGTLLIERQGLLHSHVMLVSAPETADPVLLFNGERFRCQP